MNNFRIYVLITAGRGPLECAIAVGGIQERFRDYLIEQEISFKVIEEHLCAMKGAVETIVFELEKSDIERVSSWIGTHKWICKSPVRKTHKRKNWFVKCEKISIPETIYFSEQDVTYQTFRASGPGGQHRNKVETAVRVTHNKSNLSVTATDGKSQHQNRKKALEKLQQKMKELNQISFQKQNMDQWIEQIEIQRGNPIKVFEGLKFKERK